MTSVSVTAPRVGLVLGAGGTVGLAYHAGVLWALSEVGGFTPNDAELVIGTSAGSVVGAYLRSGWTPADLWQMAMGTHPVLAGLDQADVEARRAELFTPRFRSMPDLLRRGVGSAFVLARSVVRGPAPAMPGVLRQASGALRQASGALRHAFPGGLFDMTEGSRRFTEDLPLAWPDRQLWLCAVDINSGRRVVLGRSGSPFTSLHRAVQASCAIPGFYRPVKAGPMTLVDGGAHSSTNLDLAAKYGCELIVGIVPMAWDTGSPPFALDQLARRLPARQLSGELAVARRRGARVLLLRPTAAEVRLHGFNLMRRDGWERIAIAAYDATAQFLDTPRFREGLRAA
jgi:NTE family protein